MACTYPLASLIVELATRAGADPARIDVSDLDAEVRGFLVTNGYPVSQALASLAQVFLFDPSNFDGALHFVPRGGNSVATVTENDMLAEGTDPEQLKRADPIQIPRVLHLNYHDVAGGIATDKQSSERAGDRRAKGEVSLQTPVVLNADEAARAVAINHKVMIEDAKGEVSFALSDALIRLVAADPIIVQWQGTSQRCRIVRCDVQDGYQDYVVLRDRQSAYTSEIEGIPPAPQTPPPSSIVGPTLIEPLDIHILRDVDDFLGYYVAVSGILPAWQGATIEVSLDGGANYVDSEQWTVPAVIGELVSAMADHPQAYPDEVSVVTVQIHTPHAELQETDLEGLLNRANLAVIGDEIVQFANADEVSEGYWQLSYFLRGRKGSTTAAHAPGDRFVLLERNAIPFVPASLTDLDRELTFRATSFGTTPDTGTVVAMTYTGRSQTERSPAYLTARREGDDAIIAWQGVGRLGASVHAAHGAYFAGYRVTVDDGSLTETVDTVNQSLTHDVSGFTPPITISVQQRNQLTGLGPSIEVILA